MNPDRPFFYPVLIGAVTGIASQFYLAVRLIRYEKSPWIRVLLAYNGLVVFIFLLVVFVMNNWID